MNTTEKQLLDAHKEINKLRSLLYQVEVKLEQDNMNDEFDGVWRDSDEDILIKGYPTMMLYYGNEFTFRTIPQIDVQYLIKIYGYKKNNNYSSEGDPDIQYDYWLRYLAYGAAMNYARDYRYASDVKAELKADFAHERKLMLTHTHNQIKQARAEPRF